MNHFNFFFFCGGGVVISDLFIRRTCSFESLYQVLQKLLFIDKKHNICASNHTFYYSLRCCTITQSFFHVKSSPQLIKGKSRDLQKILSYSSRIVTSTLKDGTGGCVAWLASPFLHAVEVVLVFSCYFCFMFK